MLKQNLPPEIAKAYTEWANKEWERCMQLRATFENHAITYLLTGNGGGAATVIAFAGSAGYTNPLVYWSLSCFIVGLVLCGIGIAIALTRMSWISKELSNDQREFNKLKIRTGELEENHTKRFAKKTFGTPVGYGSFACFLLGLVLSVYTFREFTIEKQLKAGKEAALDVVKQTDNLKSTSAPIVSNTPQHKNH